MSFFSKRGGGISTKPKVLSHFFLPQNHQKVKGRERGEGSAFQTDVHPDLDSAVPRTITWNNDEVRRLDFSMPPMLHLQTSRCPLYPLEGLGKPNPQIWELGSKDYSDMNSFFGPRPTARPKSQIRIFGRDSDPKLPIHHHNGRFV